VCVCVAAVVTTGVLLCVAMLLVCGTARVLAVAMSYWVAVVRPWCCGVRVVVRRWCVGGGVVVLVLWCYGYFGCVRVSAQRVVVVAAA
jgi:hypothetical protein